MWALLTPSPPPHLSLPCTETDQYVAYKSDLVRHIRKGEMAFQLLADEDCIRVPGEGGGELQDLWTCEPWMMVGMCAPDCVSGPWVWLGHVSHDWLGDICNVWEGGVVGPCHSGSKSGINMKT